MTPEAKTKNAAPPEIEFDVWVATAAALLDLDEQARWRILGSRSIDVARWERADQLWFAKLAQDVGAGEMDRPMRYAALCREEVVRRQRDAAAAAAVSAPDSPAVEPERPMAPPSVKVPTYLMPAIPENPLATSDADVDVDATIEAVLKQNSTLPFGVRPSQEFEAWLANRDAKTSPVQEPPRSTEEDIRDMLDGTALVPPGTPIAAALPFGAVEPKEPPMPIEQYASLCAALSVFPERAREIVERFGVSEEGAKRALDDAWRAAFTRSPAELARWHVLFTQFCTAMTRQG